MKSNHFIIASIILLFVLKISITGQSNNKFSESQKRDIITKASTLLKDNYVFPDVAEKIEKHLNKLFDDGAFKNIDNTDEFAIKLTTEMQSISNDKHMRCLSGNARGRVSNPAAAKISQIPVEKYIEEKKCSFGRAGKLKDGIGVLELYGFPSLGSSKESADEMMNFLSDSKLLIIDLRKNGGGSPDLIQYICSYLFEKPTHINSIYWRQENRTMDFITFEKVDGKKIPDVPVIVLTSGFTFSGGEEFAYNIQTQKRGVLIGETTGGGANPGGTFPLDFGMRVFIPTGRAINPITKTNWEGVGVKPDIQEDALKAFDTALLKANEILAAKGAKK